MRVRISRRLLDRLDAQVRSSPGQEVCGLLVGAADHIEDAIAVSNRAADPSCAFVLDIRAHFAAARLARNAGSAIIGHYHSHPTGFLTPSTADAAAAGNQGVLWLILAEGRQRLWISDPRGPVAGAFTPVELEVFETTVLQPAGTGAIEGRAR